MTVQKKLYSSPPCDRREIARYAGCRDDGCGIYPLIDGCLAQAEENLSYCVVWCEVNISVDYPSVHFPFGDYESEKLCRFLGGCSKAVIFVATVGQKYDRLLAREKILSPARSVIFQAIGSERVEALCDVFCEDIKNYYPDCETISRFSPGYGGLSLEMQKEIIPLLRCPALAGVTLSDSLMMSPSKTVSAIIGIKG